MKKNLLFICLALFCSLAVSAQTEVTVEPDGTKIIKGFMTRQDLATDSSFTWFAQNQKGFVPQAEVVDALKQQKDSIHVLAFGGTWCDDTRFLLPRFFVLTDAAGYTPDKITIVGVDRDKKTLHHLTEAFNVTRVPTFIVLKNGVEIGRVVEYGRSGMIDKEVGNILGVGN